jgi:hypothetical protein
MRQHLIVAQTINSISHSWPGVPKVVATRNGWLLSGLTGVAESVTTVEQLWEAILKYSPGKQTPKSLDGDTSVGDGQHGNIPLRVRAAGQRVWSKIPGASAYESDPSRKETK